jgi:hypothetical protein
MLSFAAGFSSIAEVKKVSKRRCISFGALLPPWNRRCNITVQIKETESFPKMIDFLSELQRVVTLAQDQNSLLAQPIAAQFSAIHNSSPTALSPLSASGPAVAPMSASASLSPSPRRASTNLNSSAMKEAAPMPDNVSAPAYNYDQMPQ